jgi:hypothetical protein
VVDRVSGIEEDVQAVDVQIKCRRDEAVVDRIGG